MFEIGDKVIYQGADKSAYKREGIVKSIEDKDGKPQLTVELGGGETFTAPIDDWSRKFNNSAPVSTNSVVRNAMAARTARNASDADVARYLAAAKDRIRAEVVALKDVAGLLKMEPVPTSAEKAYAKVVKAMASLQKAFAELS